MKQISSTEDLDNYTDTGNFYYLAGTTNAPTTGMGFLEVLSFSGVRKMQRATSISSTTKNVYIRTIYSTSATWSDWVKVGGGS